MHMLFYAGWHSIDRGHSSIQMEHKFETGKAISMGIIPLAKISLCPAPDPHCEPGHAQVPRLQRHNTECERKFASKLLESGMTSDALTADV